MKEMKIENEDGYDIKCIATEISNKKHTVALILPFGLKLRLAIPFINYFSHQFNVVAWESRFILDSCNDNNFDNLTLDKHVQDVFFILNSLNIGFVNLVGYCSGAGVALLAAKLVPESIDRLILVNGEYVLLNNSECMTQFGKDIDSLLTTASKSSEASRIISEKLNANCTLDKSEFHDQVFLPFSSQQYLYRYAKNYLSYRCANFYEIAKKIKHRTLLVTGKKDLQTTYKSTYYIKKAMPHADLYVDPTGDHYELCRANSSTLMEILSYLNDKGKYEKRYTG